MLGGSAKRQGFMTKLAREYHETCTQGKFESRIH